MTAHCDVLWLDSRGTLAVQARFRSVEDALRHIELTGRIDDAYIDMPSGKRWPALLLMNLLARMHAG